MWPCECNDLSFLPERDLRDTVNCSFQFGRDPSIRPVEGPLCESIPRLAYSLLFTGVVLVHGCC